jgi:hypothetical protein
VEFTAACRLPNTVDRKAIIDNVIELMDLRPYEKMIVGREKEGEGLPKHARKRLTIANQLVVQPKVSPFMLNRALPSIIIDPQPYVRSSGIDPIFR